MSPVITVSAGLAVVAAVVAVLLLLPVAPAAPQPGARPTLPVAAVLGVLAVLLAATASPRAVVLAGIVALTAVAARAVLRARRRQQAAQLVAGRVLEACEAIAAELGTGAPPGLVLERAALEWPSLAPVAEAFRVGADVPGAWRAAGLRPGAADLRLVAAAWEVSHRTGAGLAVTLEQVVLDLRAARSTRRVVDGELASARSTARLVAALPVVALAMGSGAGGDPWGFLLATPPGLACLGLGLACGLAGLAWIEALARGVDR